MRQQTDHQGYPKSKPLREETEDQSFIWHPVLERTEVYRICLLFKNISNILVSQVVSLSPLSPHRLHRNENNTPSHRTENPHYNNYHYVRGPCLGRGAAFGSGWSCVLLVARFPGSLGVELRVESRVWSKSHCVSVRVEFSRCDACGSDS